MGTICSVIGHKWNNSCTCSRCGNTRDVTTLMRIMISRKYPADALKFVPFVAKNVTI